MFYFKYISSSEATVLLVWVYILYYIESSCLVNAKKMSSSICLFKASIGTVSYP